MYPLGVVPVPDLGAPFGNDELLVDEGVMWGGKGGIPHCFNAAGVGTESR